MKHQCAHRHPPLYSPDYSTCTPASALYIHCVTPPVLVLFKCSLHSCVAVFCMCMYMYVCIMYRGKKISFVPALNEQFPLPQLLLVSTCTGGGCTLQGCLTNKEQFQVAPILSRGILWLSKVYYSSTHKTILVSGSFSITSSDPNPTVVQFSHNFVMEHSNCHLYRVIIHSAQYSTLSSHVHVVQHHPLAFP